MSNHFTFLFLNHFFKSFISLNDHPALRLTLNPNLLWYGHAALRFTPATADIPAPDP